MKPKVDDSYIGMGINSELNDVENRFKIVSSFSRFKHLPVIISEGGPEVCAACSVKHDPNYAYPDTVCCCSDLPGNIHIIMQNHNHMKRNILNVKTVDFKSLLA